MRVNYALKTTKCVQTNGSDLKQLMLFTVEGNDQAIEAAWGNKNQAIKAVLWFLVMWQVFSCVF